jgi:hypothetical protein
MMRDRADRELTMRRLTKSGVPLLIATALAFAVSEGAHAQPVDGAFQVAQVQKKRKAAQRAPTRIIVRPRLPYRLDSTEFPRTDNLGFPGRNAVRQCVAWLAEDHRPSGTVLVPQRRCWWQPG